MPWLPELVSAVELARRETEAAGHADPVGQYVAALNRGDTRDLETAWPVQVVVHDPYSGEVRGHRNLGRFVKRSKSFLAEHHAQTETVASTVAGDRAVVEVLGHLQVDGRELAWPVAIVAESPDDRSVEFRSYFSRSAFLGRRPFRAPILQPSAAHPGDVVGSYLAALEAGDIDAVVSDFTRDGYYREPIGPPFVHRGSDQLRSHFARCFSAGGGISLQHCAVTDDGVCCALEYNCVRWGNHQLAPQAGIAVFERAPDGLLAAARVYDDVDAPTNPSQAPPDSLR
jgi:ketosteroid isomerase-like protein